jgi:catechol 2,3-dioxygenase-like lactoylglutathione lyase family enzyme
MTMVSVRYITDDVDAAVDFYADRLNRPGAGVEALPAGA